MVVVRVEELLVRLLVVVVVAGTGFIFLVCTGPGGGAAGCSELVGGGSDPSSLSTYSPSSVTGILASLFTRCTDHFARFDQIEQSKIR